MPIDEPPDCAFASPEDPRWEALTPTQGVGPPSEPATHEEARWFHEGFLAGATAYCAAVGHSCLKRDNPKLCEVFDAQGWKTIEMFEKVNAKPIICEHGVKDGDWCGPCNAASKDAQREQLEGFDCHAGFAGMGQHPLTTTKLTCANCGEVSSNPGQFLADGRWVCTARCRSQLCDKQSYDDLESSGGIVGAP